jgi:DNA-binding IclR family transcriptional regulator
VKQGLEEGAKAVGGAQAIRRAMDVIRAVAQFQRHGATLNKVAKATDLNQSTAFRILRSLVEERMLYFEEGNRTYHLGLLAFELGLATQGRSQVQDYWRPVVEHIAQRTRLTTYLMARSGDDAVCLLCVQGAAMIRAMPMDVGQRLPLGIGAGSMAILATLDDEESRPLIEDHVKRRAMFPGGRADTEQLLKRVTEARASGFAISSGTVASGLSGIGVAIVPRQGLLQLAISVSAVAESFDPAEARQIAGTIAAAISARGQARAA